jgi:SPP1 gp7 family putative phage head morphogenesis protein
MADRAHILTDKELEEMERHLSAIYARAEKELQEKADKYFKRFEELDAKKRALVDSGKLSEKEYRRWRKNKIMTGRHWTRMKEQAAQELLQANRTAQEYINGRLPSIYSLNYNSTGEAIEGAVSGYSFELVDASTVKNLATSDKTLLPYKYVDGKKDVRWNTAKVNSEVIQGIAQGESIPKIAKRLQNVTEMNQASAIRNARTTVTSAENKGRMDSLHAAAEKGVITRKVWLAAIDARTREAHRLLNGQEQEIDDPFKSELGGIMYPGDPDADPANVYNCRCTLTYKVVGFSGGESGEKLSLLPEEERETYAERRRERLAARRQASVDFDTAPISDVQKYAETKLKTNIDFKGATEQAKRGLVKAVDRFEKAGGTVGNAKVVFGGTLGNYGYYDPKTNTIHLRTNDNFVEKMIEENARSMFKLGKPRWADPTYEGMAAHELGHAFDRYFGQEISREISRRGLLREAFSISGYAATEPAIGSPRASEAVAENIAAYLAGGDEKEKIAPEIIKILEEYFGKRK